MTIFHVIEVYADCENEIKPSLVLGNCPVMSITSPLKNMRIVGNASMLLIEMLVFTSGSFSLHAIQHVSCVSKQEQTALFHSGLKCLSRGDFAFRNPENLLPFLIGCLNYFEEYLM